MFKVCVFVCTCSYGCGYVWLHLPTCLNTQVTKKDVHFMWTHIWQERQQQHPTLGQTASPYQLSPLSILLKIFWGVFSKHHETPRPNHAWTWQPPCQGRGQNWGYKRAERWAQYLDVGRQRFLFHRLQCILQQREGALTALSQPFQTLKRENERKREKGRERERRQKMRKRGGEGNTNRREYERGCNLPQFVP